MEIALPWKNEEIQLQLDGDVSFRLVEPGDSPALKSRQIAERMHTAAYREWKSLNKTYLVIVNDGTRPTPTAEIIASDRDFFRRRALVLL